MTDKTEFGNCDTNMSIGINDSLKLNSYFMVWIRFAISEEYWCYFPWSIFLLILLAVTQLICNPPPAASCTKLWLWEKTLPSLCCPGRRSWHFCQQSQTHQYENCWALHQVRKSKLGLLFTLWVCNVRQTKASIDLLRLSVEYQKYFQDLLLLFISAIQRTWIISFTFLNAR